MGSEAVKKYQKRRYDRLMARFDDDEDGSWITTENGHHVHINAEGEPDIGNKHVLEAMSGKSLKGTSAAKPMKKNDIHNYLMKRPKLPYYEVTRLTEECAKSGASRSEVIKKAKAAEAAVSASKKLETKVSDLKHKADGMKHGASKAMTNSLSKSMENAPDGTRIYFGWAKRDGKWFRDSRNEATALSAARDLLGVGPKTDVEWNRMGYSNWPLEAEYAKQMIKDLVGYYPKHEEIDDFDGHRNMITGIYKNSFKIKTDDDVQTVADGLMLGLINAGGHEHSWISPDGSTAPLSHGLNRYGETTRNVRFSSNYREDFMIDVSGGGGVVDVVFEFSPAMDEEGNVI